MITLVACSAPEPPGRRADTPTGGGGEVAGGASQGGTKPAAGDAMGAGAGLAGAVAGGGDYGGAGSPSPTAGSGGSGGGGGPGPAPEYILGADVSWLLEDEAAGATYYDGGVRHELLQLLRSRGFNYLRLRTFVNPAAPGGYAAGASEAWCDRAHTIELAERAAALGMGLLLDLHYSDNWADPGKQVKPAAWASSTFEQLEQQVYDYTRSTVQAMADAGVKPSLVQLGNEITAGMLFPDGESSNENWPRLARLLKAGANAVQAVDPALPIVFHIEKCGDNATTRWWVDSALAQQLPLRILAQSCYTEHQGTPEQWQANFDDLVARYPDLKFLVVEYSHEKRKVNDLMRSLPNGRGLGTFIWEPTRWMEAVFDRDDQRYDANAWLDTYSQMAADYGL